LNARRPVLLWVTAVDKYDSFDLSFSSARLVLVGARGDKLHQEALEAGVAVQGEVCGADADLQRVRVVGGDHLLE
jgi:hypothetical protein